jgi:hypothetical protein
MFIRHSLIALFLVMAALPLTLPPEPGQPPGYYALAYAPVPWEIDCTNTWAWDGYLLPEFGGYCVPGILSQEALNGTIPRDFYGALSSYAPGVMERLEGTQGVPGGRGVALLPCGYMGYTVWLRIPGGDWLGPFTVVDCGSPRHRFYHMSVVGLAAEIGYGLAQTWVPAAPRVDVRIGRRPTSWHGVNLAQWWIENQLQWEDGTGLMGSH